ncbi:AAA family ATPase [Sulfurimonas sp. SAG-AH-194-C20]|nr:AAA family ATPase [Sulfurimonas sp. SAG-AH-194-C20]MDF1878442.1 AAA family ATPase [Sulfurimonas sp. SAG-AH-194-C20]
MKDTNLLHINSINISALDSLLEYQRVYINNILGAINPELMRARTNKIINCKVETPQQIWETLENAYNFYSTGNYAGVIIEEEFIVTVDWSFESTTVGLNVSVTSKSISKANEAIATIEQTLSEYLVEDALAMYTILMTNGSDKLTQTYYQDVNAVEFNHVALPFIDDVDAYIESYLNSHAPLLILQGEAGTGKSTFVKKLLSVMQTKVMQKHNDFKVTYSFDEEIFFCNDFYARIIYDDYDVLVLEDINQVILKNQDEGGIDPINKFLSVTDGIISKYKKIIITTNIESRQYINPLLQRPGRCYDVIPFRSLEREEIDDLCDSCAPELNLQTESINVSEFYARCNSERNTKLIQTRVGF